MNNNGYIWEIWAYKLRRWGIEDSVASLLEAAGPFTLLFSQLIYISQPVLCQVLPENHLKELANLLEEPMLTRAFAAYLKEDSSRELV
jgi:hypothetical protein